MDIEKTSLEIYESVVAKRHYLKLERTKVWDIINEIVTRYPLLVMYGLDETNSAGFLDVDNFRANYYHVRIGFKDLHILGERYGLSVVLTRNNEFMRTWAFGIDNNNIPRITTGKPLIEALDKWYQVRLKRNEKIIAGVIIDAI